MLLLIKIVAGDEKQGGEDMKKESKKRSYRKGHSNYLYLLAGKRLLSETETWWIMESGLYGKPENYSEEEKIEVELLKGLTIDLGLVFCWKWIQPETFEGITMEFFLCLLGMLMIVEGLPYFAFPERMKFWLQKIFEMPDEALRKFGFIIMSIGLFLVYLGKS